MCSFRPPRRGWALRPRRLLILAEGRSNDPHYGKTARGVLRYRPEDVVAVLDSESSATEPTRGSRSCIRSREARTYEPTTALVGVATQGGRFPPAWRALLKDCIRDGLDVENGLHEFISTIRSLSRSPASTVPSCATCGCRRRA